MASFNIVDAEGNRLDLQDYQDKLTERIELGVVCLNWESSLHHDLDVYINGELLHEKGYEPDPNDPNNYQYDNHWSEYYGRIKVEQVWNTNVWQQEGNAVFNIDLGNGNVIKANFTGKFGAFIYNASADILLLGSNDLTDEFTITAIDADGDHTQADLTFTVETKTELPPVEPFEYPEPEIIAQAPASLYESGLRESGAPEGQSASGEGSFLVNLYGADGEIEVMSSRYGETIEIVNGESAFDPAKADTLEASGIEFTITGVGQTDDGQWEISYSYGISDPGYYYDRHGEPTHVYL